MNTVVDDDQVRAHYLNKGVDISMNLPAQKNDTKYVSIWVVLIGIAMFLFIRFNLDWIGMQVCDLYGADWQTERIIWKHRIIIITAVLFVLLMIGAVVFAFRNEGEQIQEDKSTNQSPEDEPNQNETYNSSVYSDLDESNSLEEKYAKTLGLSGKVTVSEIKRMYRLRAKEYHPDKANRLGEKLKNMAEKEMIEINEAYAYFLKKYENRDTSF
jgi:DnaJ-domain-containing protein 1